MGGVPGAGLALDKLKVSPTVTPQLDTKGLFGQWDKTKQLLANTPKPQITPNLNIASLDATPAKASKNLGIKLPPIHTTALKATDHASSVIAGTKTSR